MRTDVRDTSLEAYDDLKASGTLGRQEGIIYCWVIERGRPATLQEISRGTGLAINAVSGRVNKLKAKGKLEEYDKVKCPITAKTVTPVGKVRPKPAQAELFDQQAEDQHSYNAGISAGIHRRI